MRVLTIATTTSWGVAVSLILLLPLAQIKPPPPPPQVPVPAPQTPAPAAPVPPAPVFSLVWQAAVEVPGAPQMVAGESAIFVADDERGITALSIQGGKALWTVPRPSTVPVATGHGLVIVHSGGSLRALDAATGVEKWSADVEAPALGAAVSSAGVFAAVGSTLRAWRLDGTALWTQPLAAAAATPLVLHQDRIYAALADSALVAVDAATGARLWQIPLVSLPKTLLATEDRLYFSAADGAVYAFDQDGSPDWAWRFDVHAEAIGRLAADDRCVYAALIDNSVKAFKRGSGNLCWATPINQRPAAGPVVSEQTIAIATVTGRIVGIERVEGKVIGEPTPAPPGETGTPRLLATASAADGATIYTLTVTTGLPPTVTAFRRSSTPVKIP